MQNHQDYSGGVNKNQSGYGYGNNVGYRKLAHEHSQNSASYGYRYKDLPGGMGRILWSFKLSRHKICGACYSARSGGKTG